MKQIGDKINEYMRNVHRFADIFNYYLYDGKPSVNADQLHELSPDKTTPPLVQNVLGETAHNAFSHFIAMRDDHMVYLLLNVSVRFKLRHRRQRSAVRCITIHLPA